MISILRPARQEIDLDERAARERGDANAGARGQAPGHEIGLVDRVHRRVIALEMRQINPRKHALVALVFRLSPSVIDISSVQWAGRFRTTRRM